MHEAYIFSSMVYLKVLSNALLCDSSKWQLLESRELFLTKTMANLERPKRQQRLYNVLALITPEEKSTEDRRFVIIGSRYF